jgi:hypothetical protein
MPDQTNVPAIWSAIAATFSALSAFIMVMIHRRNLLDAARPELVITGWKRATELDDGGQPYESITFATIRNIGRGAAFNVYAGSKLQAVGDHLLVGGPGTVVAVIPAGEKEDVEGYVQTYVHWDRLKRGSSHVRTVDIPITLRSVDARGMQHSTEYLLQVFDESHWAQYTIQHPHVRLLAFSDDIAPGIRMLHRRTTTRPMWRVRLTRHARVEWRRFVKRTQLRESAQAKAS